MPTFQCRAVCFTSFLTKTEPKLGKLQYIAYCLETCPKTKRLHWQAFAYSHTKLSFTAWQKVLPRKAHIEVMRGTFADNEKYCSKAGKLIEHGIKPMESGRKRSLEEMKDELDAGYTPVEIATRDPRMFGVYCQYRSGLKEYSQYIRDQTLKENRDVPDVYVRIGPPGTGKTRWLDENYGKTGWVFAPDNSGKWFDGCDRDVICFDDVGFGEVPPFKTFLHLTDRYPRSVQTKGGFITWKPKVIVFTANTHPYEWWPNLSEFDKLAMIRRIKDIVVVE